MPDTKPPALNTPAPEPVVARTEDTASDLDLDDIQAEAAQRRRQRRLLWGIVIIPMILAIVYYALLADSRYVSQAQVAVRQTNGESSQALPGLAMMLTGTNPTSREETLYLREYIRSQDMLDALNAQLDWTAHFADRWRDPLYWLPADATTEDQLTFYQRLVNAQFDEETGLLMVTVEALDPAFAQDSLAFILKASEVFVNELSHRMAREQVRFAEDELARAHRDYETERNQILDFQRQNQFLDAGEAAKKRAAIIGELESRLVTAHAELKALNARLAGDAPAVRTKQTEIRALEQQLAVENKRLLSDQGQNNLNVVAAQFRKLEVDGKIAEETYKLSVVALQSARIEASKKIRSLVTVVSPNLPDEALYPRRLYNLFTLLIVLLLVYGITRFIIASIEDHRD
ncbi:Wzz/FepE/Etk N-terminal domain-containing protein [uncultured Castellaniella sp.]|uniref:Wzz/FepE/Etk N-terminal domain-containing protein n=1 Tax=uncultured Castellaniella sp. TaxID=647907 RepID=UPI0026145498|nr:Wzz/FepE/Etk N-terminal domain-containing protein [uncultured Castellaniella sp.]